MGTDDNDKSNQTLQDASASSSVAKPQASWEPRVTWHRETFKRFSGATSKRICGVSSDLVRIHVSEFMGVLAWIPTGLTEKVCRNFLLWVSDRLISQWILSDKACPHSGRRATLRTAPPLTHSSKNTKSVIEVSTSLLLLQHRSLC